MSLLRIHRPLALTIKGRVSRVHFEVKTHQDICYVEGRRLEAISPPGGPPWIPPPYNKFRFCVPLLKHPSPLSQAVINDFHDTNHLKSPAFTNSVCSASFHIPGGLAGFKLASKVCYYCKRIYKTTQPPEIGPAPEFRYRLTHQEFTLVADILGPFRYTTDPNHRPTRSRPQAPRSKVWILLAADTYTRRLYWAPLDSLSVVDLSAGLGTLFATSGKPTRIETDAGSQFLAGSPQDGHDPGKVKQPESSLHSEDEGPEGTEPGVSPDTLRHLKQAMENLGIAFKTQVPKSPWRSGADESLVKGFKRMFNASVNKSTRLTLIQLFHLVSRCADTMNNRPICVLPGEASDPREPWLLTANALSPTHSNVPLDYPSTRQMKDNDKLRELGLRLEAFKALHEAHYTKTLRHLCGRFPTSDTISIGDIIMVPHPHSTTGLPILGRVINTSERNAQIKYHCGRSRPRTFWRPKDILTLLVPGTLVPTPNEDSVLNMDIYYITTEDRESRPLTALHSPPPSPPPLLS